MNKKIFSFIIALAAASAVANASAVAPVDRPEAESSLGEIIVDMAGNPVSAPVMAFDAGDEEVLELDFHYCGDPQSTLRTGELDAIDIENSAAIMLPASFVEKFAGAEIVSVIICTGCHTTNYYTNNITDATVFLSYDIFDDEPFYTQRGRLSKSARTWSEIKLNTPYKIEADKPLFVGYKVIRPTIQDCPFAADRSYTYSDYSFWINYQNEGVRRWENWSEEYGNLCMHVKLRGSSLPSNDVELSSLNVPLQVDKGTFNVSFSVRNLGVNDVSSINYSCSVDGKTIDRVYKFSEPIKFSNEASVSLALNCDRYGQDIPVSVTVTGINGVPDIDPSNNTKEGSFLCLDPALGYDRIMVMEEGTGLWCPNCPRGAAAMEYMSKKYPDTFIGISIHHGTSSEPDPMEITDPDLVPDHSYWYHMAMLSAYPNARYNRDDTKGFTINNFGAHAEEIYNSLRSIPSVCKISANIYYSDEEKTKIHVQTESEFALETSVPYAVALVLLENNLGPYIQSNGFTGYIGDTGGWGDLPSQASVIFNDVVCYVDNYYGISGVFPDTKKARYVYPYNAELPTSVLKSRTDYDVVALLINSKTGQIENAAKCHGSEALEVKEFTSIDGVSVSSPVKVEAAAGGVRILGSYSSASVFGFNGSAVAVADGSDFIALPAGFYIVNVDGVATKLQVR